MFRSKRCAVVATVSTTTETEETWLTTGLASSPWWRSHLIVVWTVWALACWTAMVMLPGDTIPFHLGWVGFAIAFGFGTWSRWQLVTSVTWYSLATGTVLVLGWQQGHLGWEEPAEVPLMCLLAVLSAWLVRRSRTAQAQLANMAEQNLQASRDRERLIQLTSHELRTPLTIARGYIEVMQTRNLEDPQDLCVVADELDRLAQVSDRRWKSLTSTRSWPSWSSAGRFSQTVGGCWTPTPGAAWGRPNGCAPA